mmetsp:Transcript_40859/g.87735  ORF Transcript_40859/g.87735 Transcript_40859/m.87735 type:complete len:206 (-) Transcript_40859:799-1416(-)
MTDEEVHHACPDELAECELLLLRNGDDQVRDAIVHVAVMKEGLEEVEEVMQLSSRDGSFWRAAGSKGEPGRSLQDLTAEHPDLGGDSCRFGAEVAQQECEAKGHCHNEGHMLHGNALRDFKADGGRGEDGDQGHSRHSKQTGAEHGFAQLDSKRSHRRLQRQPFPEVRINDQHQTRVVDGLDHNGLCGLVQGQNSTSRKPNFRLH